MKILIVSLFDDNFGDMLIRICFERILKVALKNIGLAESDFVIEKMPLKNINQKQIEESSCIFVAGGGLIGISYLNFFEFLDKITDIADENNIPVIMSSLGINNMGVTSETEGDLERLFHKKCIKALSVRENPNFFRKYSQGCDYEIAEVCDPAVWTRYVYGAPKQEKARTDKKVIGINVVRGGLFCDNKYEWKFNDETLYLDELRNILESNGYEYILYTNGSLSDNNALLEYSKKREISAEKIFYTFCTSDLVRLVSSCDAIATIRMHSSIIAYSFEIPSVNLIWNDKIPLFYKNINRESDAVLLGSAAETAQNVFSALVHCMTSKHCKVNETYAMSLYTWLCEICRNLFTPPPPVLCSIVARKQCVYGECRL